MSLTVNVCVVSITVDRSIVVGNYSGHIYNIIIKSLENPIKVDQGD